MMKNFFLSLKTTVWILFVLICLFFIGSYLMPAHPEVFSSMNENILIEWMENVAVLNAWQSWWFFAVLAGLALLALNTLACSLQAVRGKWSRSDFLVRISPQVVHIGFLLILFAHLLTAAWGYKVSGTVPERAFARLPERRVLALNEVRVLSDAAGRMTGLAAAVSLYENNKYAASGVLGPNNPLFYKGAGIYLKSLDFEQGPSAVLMVVRDPGAIWALIGSILFIIGSATLLVLKWNAASAGSS